MKACGKSSKVNGVEFNDQSRLERRGSHLASVGLAAWQNNCGAKRLTFTYVKVVLALVIIDLADSLRF
jgi:hypothetical protein